MPRSSGRRSAPAPAPARRAPPPPARAPPPPAPAMSAPPPAPAASGGGGMMGGLMGTMVQGMAFGTGSAVANRAVDSVMGPRQVEHVHNGAEGAAAPAVAAGAAPAGGNMAGKCMDEKEWLRQCMSQAANDVQVCQNYQSMYQQCMSN